MKFLYFTDIHATSNTPSGRNDIFLMTVSSKLRQVADIGQSQNVDFYVCGGDIFNIPKPAMECINEVILRLSFFEKPIYTAVGSHDHYNYQWQTLPRTALGILNTAKILDIVESSLQLSIKDSYAGMNTALYFTHHTNMLDKAPENFEVKKEEGKFHIHVVHGSIYKERLPGDMILPDEYPNDWMNLVLCGHIHHPFSVKNKDGVLFYNPGSLLRMKVNERHVPKVAVVTITDDISIEEFELQYDPAALKVSNTETEIVENKIDFTELFKQMNLTLGNKLDVKQILQEASSDEKVLQEALNVLETVNG